MNEESPRSPRSGIGERQRGERPKGERAAKLIARAGLCSRREAEAWIAAGRVGLDGAPLASPAVAIDDPARLTVDGRPLPAAEAPRLWRYHKPVGVITAARDPQGRRTLAEALPAELGRVMPVGRLDLTSEGLLLLTNDGAVKRRLELPSSAWTRRYRVRAHGRVDAAALERLAEGIEIEGLRFGPIEARIERQGASNAWLSVSLKEGKNREVRRVLQHLGLTVNRLIRTAYGPFALGDLPRGAVAEIAQRQVRAALGLESAREVEARKRWAKAKPKARKPGAKRRRPAKAASDNDASRRR